MTDEKINDLEKIISETEHIEQSLKKKTFDLQTVSDVSQDVGSMKDTREIMENLLMMTMGNLGALNGVILLVDTDKSKIETIVQRGMDDNSVYMIRREIESGYFELLQRAIDVHVPGEKSDKQQKEERKILDLLLSFKMKIWIPFKVNKNLDGSIGLGERLSGSTYTDDDLELLNTLSNQGAVAIRNAKSTQQQEKEFALNKYHQESKENRYSNVIWKSKVMKRLLHEIEDISKTDDSVTIIGEAGTGKELFARNIHSLSARAGLPVIEYGVPIERRMSELSVQESTLGENNMERRQGNLVECDLFGCGYADSSGDAVRKIGFLQLTDGGTIIIKNIENMPLSSQEKFVKFLETGSFLIEGCNESVCSDVRVIVTTSDIDLAKSQLRTGLFDLLTTNKLEIPPLRERKRDIPVLVEHFIEKIRKTKHIKAKTCSKEATNKLLKYDYPGNVNELENVINRAVGLSSDSVAIEEEMVFLGDTDTDNKIRFNLLRIPLIKRLCESDKLIKTLKITVLFFFILLLYFIALQSGVSIGGSSIALIICWQLGLPLMFLMFLFVGRFSCAVCPMNCISEFLIKYASLKIPIPSFIKKQGAWITGTGFVCILFIESYTHMADSVTKTAYLVFSILFASILADFVFEKSAWCRYLCPMGGLGSLFSMSSMIEIRANRHTCTTICSTHDCFKGTERVEPCPMFLHLQFLSDNRDCKVCLNCIKSCNHNSTQMNIRIPGAEIATLRQPALAGAVMSILLSGMLLAEIFYKGGNSHIHFHYIVFLFLPFALILNLISNYFTASMSEETTIEHLKHFGYTLLPLTLFGYISLKIMEIFEDMNGTVELLGIYKLNYNLISIIQFFLVGIGLLLASYLIYKVVQNRFAKDKQLLVCFIQGIVPVVFAVLYLLFF